MKCISRNRQRLWRGKKCVLFSRDAFDERWWSFLRSEFAFIIRNIFERVCHLEMQHVVHAPTSLPKSIFTFSSPKYYCPCLFYIKTLFYSTRRYPIVEHHSECASSTRLRIRRKRTSNRFSRRNRRTGRTWVRKLVSRESRSPNYVEGVTVIFQECNRDGGFRLGSC